METSMETSLDTTWNESILEEDVNPDQTKLIALRSKRIETKGGTTKKFVLDSVITPKRNNRPSVAAGPSRLNYENAPNAIDAPNANAVEIVDSNDENYDGDLSGLSESFVSILNYFLLHMK